MTDRTPLDLSDPAVVDAYSALGYLKEDLLYPTNADLNLYTRDPEFRMIVLDQLRQDVDDRIAHVREEMAKEQAEEDQNPRTPDNAQPAMSYFAQEQQRIYRAEQRNRREVEQLIFSALLKKYRAEDENRRMKAKEDRRLQHEQEVQDHQRQEHEKQLQRRQRHEEAERKRKLEEEEARQKELQREIDSQARQLEEAKKREEKAQMDEQVRRERLERTQAQIQKLDADRHQKALELQWMLEEREGRRLRAQEEAQAKAAERRAEQNKKRQQAFAKAVLERRRLLQQVRRKAADRDRKVGQILEHQRQDQEKKMNEQLEREAEKIQKHRECVAWQNEARRKKTQEIVQREADAMLRVQENERQREERAAKARQGDGGLGKKMKEKCDRLDLMLKEREAVQVEASRKREEAIERSRAALQRKREKQAVLARLAMEKKKWVVQRAQRRQEAVRQQRQKVLNDRDEYQREVKRAKDESLNGIRRQQADMMRRKMQLNEKMMMMAHATSETDDTELRELASMFNLDFEAIDKRARDPRAHRGVSVAQQMGAEERGQDAPEEAPPPPPKKAAPVIRPQPKPPPVIKPEPNPSKRPQPSKAEKPALSDPMAETLADVELPSNENEDVDEFQDEDFVDDAETPRNMIGEALGANEELDGEEQDEAGDAGEGEEEAAETPDDVFGNETGALGGTTVDALGGGEDFQDDGDNAEVLEDPMRGALGGGDAFRDDEGDEEEGATDDLMRDPFRDE
jgi:hypothetical protein